MFNDSLVIRQLLPQDLPGLEWNGELIHLKRLFSQAYTQYREGNAVLWVVDQPGEGIVAQVFIQLIGQRRELVDGISRAYIYGFRVRPAHRGQGIGTRMMVAVEADLRRRGYRLATLNVNKDNHAALRLYKRLGYRIVADEPGCWSYIDHLGRRVDVDEPAWRMEKCL